MKLNTTVMALELLLAYTAEICEADSFDVTKYGAKADGKTNITQALLSAWKDACAAATPSSILIPGGVYVLDQVTFEGPCRSPINMIVQGTLKAPVDTKNFLPTIGWVSFSRIDRFAVSGNGVFDGQGKAVWGKKCDRAVYCENLPSNLRFNSMTNSMIRDITSKDSKQFHAQVIGCVNMTFYQFTASASGDSPNTNGIHLGRSLNISITNSNFKTGDDCVSIADGSRNISITRLNCGPGHGISVGSLGLYEHEEAVDGITATGCTLTETLNGIRIKTWPGSPEGVASNMYFEDITLKDVGNPIIIDQEYCPYNSCPKNPEPSHVKISNVSFAIRGTPATPVAVSLSCSPAVPCQNIKLSGINLKGSSGPAESLCKNAKPILSGRLTPKNCSA